MRRRRKFPRAIAPRTPRPKAGDRARLRRDSLGAGGFSGGSARVSGKAAKSKENAPMSATMLTVNGIEVIYNHVILVLKGVSLTVPEGGIVALLGGNGAGKTTTLRAVSNLLKGERGEVTKGYIEYKGERIEKLTPADLVKRGVIQVMEGRHCFPHLTLEDNLLTGAYTRKVGRDFGAAHAAAIGAGKQIVLDRQVREAVAPLHHLNHAALDQIGRRELLDALALVFDVALGHLAALAPEQVRYGAEGGGPVSYTH